MAEAEAASAIMGVFLLRENLDFDDGLFVR